MSSFRVQLDKPGPAVAPKFTPAFQSVAYPTRRFRRILTVTALVVVTIAAAGATGFYLYYQSFKDTPQYSLALLVDAAKRDDRAAMDQFIDINSVAEDFVPQITDKAVELYGRGVPPPIIEKARRLATPIMPAVKERARAELPRVIRSRTERFGYVPFAGMVLAADRYLDIVANGETASIRSKLPEHNFEVTMLRRGDRWQIVAVKEEQLATDIARTIGQEIMAIAAKGLTKETAERLGVGNVADLIRQAEELVR